MKDLRRNDPDRADLAAALRWTARMNLHEAVGNHFSLAVNDSGTRFLINPNARHFARLRASDLIEIDADDPTTMDRPDAPDPTAWGLHGSIHRALPGTVVHTHVEPREDPRAYETVSTEPEVGGAEPGPTAER